MIIEENNQSKQGGRKSKTVDYCLQYGICRILLPKELLYIASIDFFFLPHGEGGTVQNYDTNQRGHTPIFPQTN